MEDAQNILWTMTGCTPAIAVGLLLVSGIALLIF